jgi:hypothetical protein
MTMRKTSLGFLILIFILINLPKDSGAAEKTLRRVDDPLVVEGKTLAPFRGERLDRLSLMVWTDEGFKPVPFQVDERDTSGEYVFAMYVEGDKIMASKAVDQDPGLDANDELVFMVFDAGDRSPDGSFPQDAEKGVELEIIDPVDSGRAWIYLFAFENEPPRSELDYIKIINDPKKQVNRIEAKNYIIEQVQNAIYYSYLSIIQSDGTKSPDLVDRLKIRCVASIAFNTIKIPFAMDELIKTEPIAFTDGPVRVIILGQGYMEGPAGIKLRGKPAVVKNYPNFFIYPIYLALPLDVKTLLSDFHLHGENDFNENAYGAYYYDEHNPYNPEVVFDGRMSDAEKNMNYKADHEWMVMTGPQGTGTCVFRILFPPEWDFINKGLYYKDDPGFEDPPEDHPGSIAAGFDMENFIALKKGSFLYYFHYYFPQDFKVGDEVRILNIIDHPLQVKVRKIKTSAN